MMSDDLEVFCALLKLAWISERPGYLPAEREVLRAMLKDVFCPATISDAVMAQFHRQKGTGLLFFPPQVRALRRLVAGEDMYSLLWDESL